MKENNVVHLAQYIESKKEVHTFNQKEFEYFDIKDDRITLRRVSAFAADFFIILAIFNMAQVSYMSFVQDLLVPLDFTQKSSLLSGTTSMNIAMFAFIYLTYFFFNNYIMHGKTLGKKWMSLTVINEDYIFFKENYETQLNVSQAMRRSFGKFLCYISFGTFFILNVINEEKRGIPDMLSRTRVVSDEWFDAFKANKNIDLESVKIDINSLDRVA